MKNVFLLCNAHIDPVWLWKKQDGIAEALSTFRVAAKFCEDYDNFIFNHNEAILYEWVNEYEPDLFLRIQKLVKKGKWKIMGGWYLQPDCNMLSGESFIRQISTGQQYFKQNFDVTPTVAINFDPFGHTRGLVQILNIMGYKGYIFMRPTDIPHGEFIWKGFDDSTIICHKNYSGYNSLKGDALNKIKSCIKEFPNRENDLILWGIGNHGGGPSKCDLDDINNFISVSKDYTISHSYCEEYFDEIKTEELKIVDESLNYTMVGCFTSMVKIKQLHRKLENDLSVCKKAMSYAGILYNKNFDQERIVEAEKALMFSQFHDILPGSCVKVVEDYGMQLLSHGIELVDGITTKAFFTLCNGQEIAREGEIPVMVFNPHPYEIETEIEVEFLLQNQNWTKEEITIATVYDKDRKALPTQNEKPAATFNLDWVLKTVFFAKLAPSSISRFDCMLKAVKNEKRNHTYNECIIVKNDMMQVEINTKTGLIDKYCVLDYEYLINQTGVIEVYNDNEDPWAMQTDGFYEKIGEFRLLTDEQANSFNGYPKQTTPNVKIIEDGDVRTVIQATFGYSNSFAIVEYSIPKLDNYIDVSINMLSNDANKMYKYKLESTFKECSAWGQTAFGSQKLSNQNNEVVFLQWCAISDKTHNLSVINDGIYGGSFDENSIKLSLLRTPLYAAHPIEDRQIAPTDRHINHIDVGERFFNFRITSENHIDSKALLYNEKPIVLSFFPSGNDIGHNNVIEIDNKNVLLTYFYKEDDDFIIHIYNSTDSTTQVRITIASFDIDEIVTLNKYDIQFFSIHKNGLSKI